LATWIGLKAFAGLVGGILFSSPGAGSQSGGRPGVLVKIRDCFEPGRGVVCSVTSVTAGNGVRSATGVLVGAGKISGAPGPPWAKAVIPTTVPPRIRVTNRIPMTGRLFIQDLLQLLDTSLPSDSRLITHTQPSPGHKKRPEIPQAAQGCLVSLAIAVLCILAGHVMFPSSSF